MADKEEHKVVVLGGGGVGKSALTIRLITDNFLEEYDPTIEDSYRKMMTIDDVPAILDILDTAGQEEYSSMQDQWIRDGKGFLLVYSITDPSSFDEVSVFKEKILRIKDAEAVPMVIAGNKCDMVEDRQVAKDEAEALSAEWGCPFMETSAKEKICNEECFYEVVREIRKFNAKTTKAKPKKKLPCCIL